LLACLCHVALEYCVFSRTRSEQAMASTIRDDDGVVNPSHNPHLNDLVDAATTQSPARRDLLKSGFGLASLSFLGLGAAACGSDGGDSAPVVAPPVVTPPKGVISFKSVAASSADTFVVPEGYTAQVLYRWGDPIYTSSPAFKGDASESSLDQEGQSGDNHDGMQFFPLKNADGTQRSDAGVLAINHEYINPEYFYAPGSDPANWMNPFTFEKAKKAQAGHGVSIVEVRRKADASWEYLRSSPYNRRITAYTAMQMTGPAAGNDLLKTAADPTGTRALGTAQQLRERGHALGHLPDLRRELQRLLRLEWRPHGQCAREPLRHRPGRLRLPLARSRSALRCERQGTRTSPTASAGSSRSIPTMPAARRRSAPRWAASSTRMPRWWWPPTASVVVYLGDDERNEYIYKFVSTATYDARNPATGKDILDAGTLYVARFNAGASATDRLGDGTWIPLVHGQNGLTVENGFANQAEVLIKARMAADRVGATMMDRPEWIATNPSKAGEVYCTLTNNNRRGSTPASSNSVGGTTVAGSARPPVDDPNPRANNVWGHIIRWNETGGDATALTFAWDIFVLAGNPKKYADRTDPALRAAANDHGRQPVQQPGRPAPSIPRPPVDPDRRQQHQRRQVRRPGQQPDAGWPTWRPARCAASWSARRAARSPGVTWNRRTCHRTMFVNVQHPGELGRPSERAEEGRRHRFTDNDIARDPTRFSKLAGRRRGDPSARRGDRGYPQKRRWCDRHLTNGGTRRNRPSAPFAGLAVGFFM
jgi:secreted PhoX family phosphatase